MNQAVATQQKKSAISKNLDNTKPDTFSNFMTSPGVKKKIDEMMGGSKGSQFITSLVAAVTLNPQLAECDRGTILSAAMQGAALNFSPSPVTGQFYMVPYGRRGSDVKQAQFQIGYKGYLQLAIRSGQYRKINVIDIREGEFKRWDRLNEVLYAEFIDNDAIRETLPVVGYYAFFELMGGFTKGMYWSREKMEIHADRYSSAFSMNVYKKLLAGEIPEKELWKYSSFWYKDFDQMAFKTMLRQLISKWGIMSIELQTAFEKDMSVIDGEGRVSYADNDLMDIPMGEVQPVSTTGKTAGASPVDDFFDKPKKDNGMTLAEVNDKLMKADTLDKLDEAASIINLVENEDHKTELFKVYQTERKRFEQ